MAKIVEQWDRQAVGSPSLNAINKIFRCTSVCNSCFCFGTRGWKGWSFRKILTCPALGNWVRKGLKQVPGQAQIKMQSGCIMRIIVDNSTM